MTASRPMPNPNDSFDFRSQTPAEQKQTEATRASQVKENQYKGYMDSQGNTTSKGWGHIAKGLAGDVALAAAPYAGMATLGALEGGGTAAGTSAATSAAEKGAASTAEKAGTSGAVKAAEGAGATEAANTAEKVVASKAKMPTSTTTQSTTTAQQPSYNFTGSYSNPERASNFNSGGYTQTAPLGNTQYDVLGGND